MSAAVLLAACAELPSVLDAAADRYPDYISGDPRNAGLRFDEAAQFIESCIELDNQDDRVGYSQHPERYKGADPAAWQPRIDPARRAIPPTTSTSITRRRIDD